MSKEKMKRVVEALKNICDVTIESHISGRVVDYAPEASEYEDGTTPGGDWDEECDRRQSDVDAVIGPFGGHSEWIDDDLEIIIPDDDDSDQGRAADIDRTRVALRAAPQFNLTAPQYMTHAYDHDWSGSTCEYCNVDPVFVADMRRDQPWPELPEAAAREGMGYMSGPLVQPDGRMKYTCAGTPEQVAAWLSYAESMYDETYGDPARGYAEAYNRQ